MTVLAGELDGYRMPAAARDPAFNVTWHDWLNLTNLVDVSKVIVHAALAREAKTEQSLTLAGTVIGKPPRSSPLRGFAHPHLEGGGEPLGVARRRMG